MNNTIIKKLYHIFLIISAATSINTFAAGSTNSPPPPVGQPLGISLEMASGWIVLPNVQYQGDNLYVCKFDFWTSKNNCSNEPHDPQKVVEKKMGSGYYASGIAPFLDSRGIQSGVVLYYKRKE